MICDLFGKTIWKKMLSKNPKNSRQKAAVEPHEFSTVLQFHSYNEFKSE